MFKIVLFAMILSISPTTKPAASDNAWSKFAELKSWDDGLSEMCYYDATETIYGKTRRFTRVHMMNRQWMDRSTGVKSTKDAPGAVAVFKLNISEEIPTENYNYRYLTTVFVERPSLKPFKMAASSQEWCGTTFKHLRWGSSRLEVKSFSYFGDEGDHSWSLEKGVIPFESLPLQARAVAASGVDRSFKVLVPMRSTHQVQPTVTEITLGIAAKTKTRKTEAGEFEVVRVNLTDGTGENSGWFDIEVNSPHRLIAFSAGGVEGVLKHTEKRPYWDRTSQSSFYPVGSAP